MEKYGFVYLWFDRKHKRYYIGCHWGAENDGYICSSTWMRNSFNRRPHDFKRRIIERGIPRDKLFEREYRWLQMIPDEQLAGRYYNVSKKHFNHWSSTESSHKSAVDKMANTLKERAANMTEEERKTTFGARNKGRVSPKKGKTIEELHGDEAETIRQKIKDARQRQVISESHKAALRKNGVWNKGMTGIYSEETRQKMSMSTKGKFWFTNGTIAVIAKEAPGPDFVRGRK